MEDFIDAEDMLDMLFDKQVNMLAYLPIDILQHIISFLPDFTDIINLHFIATRLLKVMQHEITWKKLCLVHKFAFLHDENKDWKKYFFESDQLARTIQKIDYRALISHRFFGGNDKWTVANIPLDGGGACMVATSGNLTTKLEDHNFMGEAMYCQVTKDSLLVGDRRNVKFFDLEDGKCYDHILTFHNIETMTYEPHSKVLFAGTDDGAVLSWRSSRAKVTVGGSDPRNHTVDRPCITMKGHIGTVTALVASVEATDAIQRVVSGGEDTTIVSWRKIYENGSIGYKKDQTLLGHSHPIKELLTFQNKLISTDFHTIKIWDLLTGQNLFTHAVTPTPKQSTRISFSCNFLACVAAGNVRVWDAITGECASQFSLDLQPIEKVKGALLLNCFLFVFTNFGGASVTVWNIVSKQVVAKWVFTTYEMIPKGNFKIQLFGSGKAARVVVSSTGVLLPVYSHLYFEYRAVPPPLKRFGKRKREMVTVS